MKKVFANLTVKIGADTKQFTNQMRKTKRQTSGLSKQFSKLGGMMAGAFGIYAVGRVVSGAIKKNIQFEKSMADVKAITKATGDQLQKLENDALKLGASTEHTASAVAGLQKEFGKLGFSTDEILAATSATLDLATATGEELAISAEVAGATIRGFGKDAKETRAVVDLMAASFTSSALDLNRFAESMKYVAPIAKVAGVEIEEVTAMLAIMADAGIHGSMAGTALKKILSKLATDGKTVTQVISELADGNIDLAEAEKLVGERGKAALLVLTGNVDKLRELTTEYQNTSGAAKEMADIQRATVAGSLAMVSSAWEGLVLKMQGSSGFMMNFLSSVARLLQDIGSALGGDTDVKTKAGLSGLTEKQLKDKIAWYESQNEQYMGVIRKANEDENEEKVLQYWRLSNIAEKEVKRLQAELDRRIQIIKDAQRKEDLIHYEAAKKAQALAAKRAVPTRLDPVTGMSLQEVVDKEREDPRVKVMVTRDFANSLAALNAQIAENNRLIQESTDLDQIGKLQEENELLKKQMADVEKLTGANKDLTESNDELGNSALNMQRLVSDAIIQMADVMAESIAKMFTQGATVGDFFNGLIAVVAQFMRALGAALIASAIASEVFKELLLTNPWAAMAAGFALQVAAGLVTGIMRNAPALAAGGLAFGPTMAMVGDNPGARSDPEVIAPLSKLSGMMGGGNITLDGQFRIRGTDLVLLVDKTNDRKTQYS